MKSVFEEEKAAARQDFLMLSEIYGVLSERKLHESVADFYEHMSMQTQFEISPPPESEKELELLFGKIKDRLLLQCEDLLVRTEQAEFVRNIPFVTQLKNSLSFGEEITAPRGKIPPLFENLNDEYKLLKEKVKRFLSADKERKEAKPASNEIVFALSRLAKKVNSAFAEHKKSHGKLDFSDLEHFALEILLSKEGENIKNQYSNIFVDEYQDVNPLQDSIITALGKGRNNLFLVGDLKQSIYAFRGCEPSIFLDKYRLFLHDEHAEAVELNLNHRSCNGILTFANEVFSRAMTNDFGSIDYKNEGSFEPTLREDDGVKVHFFSEETKELPAVYDLRNHQPFESKQAQMIVDCILHLLTKTISDGEEKRPVLYSDIAILLRAATPLVGVLADKLDRLGIKTAISPKLQRTKEPLSARLIEFLHVVDNKRNDKHLVNAMLGPFGGFLEQELLSIRQNSEGDFFFESVLSYSKEDSLKKKIDSFLAKVEEYATLASLYSPARVVGKVVSDHNYFRYAFLQGEAGVEALSSFLSSIPKQKAKNLCEFLTMLGETPLPTSGGDAINIMTVHGSKGLEFPFVILPDTQKKFNLSDAYSPVILLKGFAAAKHFDMQEKTTHPSADWLLFKSRLVRRQKEEELRLLYVALTRAKYRLDIFSADSSDEQKDKEPEDAASWSKWLRPFFARHKGEEFGGQGIEKEKVIFPSPSKELKQELEKRIATKVEGGKLPSKTYVTALLHQSDEEEHVYLFADEAEQETQKSGDTSSDLFIFMEMNKHSDIQTDKKAKNQSDRKLSNHSENLDNNQADNKLSNKAYIQADNQIEGKLSYHADIKANEQAVIKGNAYHDAMKSFDFTLPIEPQWEQMRERFPLVKSEEIIKCGQIIRQRFGTNSIFKEQPFVMSMPAFECGFEGEQDILVQGVIDLLAISGQEAVIVDYKSGGIESSYKKQLQLYALAVERILGLCVTEKYIYSFRKGELVDINDIE
jgi:ATP-dependent helicase/nuclease subunit A